MIANDKAVVTTAVVCGLAVAVVTVARGLFADAFSHIPPEHSTARVERLADQLAALSDNERAALIAALMVGTPSSPRR